LAEHDVKFVDPLEVDRLRKQHQVAVTARPDRRERAQQVVARKVLACSNELALVSGTLCRIESTPLRVDFEKRVLDEVTRGHLMRERRSKEAGWRLYDGGMPVSAGYALTIG
jgi:hypothetical protein